MKQSKEALAYISNHGVWQFASIHGWTTPDPKLIESFGIVKKDLEVLEENKDLLLELVKDSIASIKFTEFACGGKPTLQEKLSKLMKLKEWLEK